MFVVDLLRDLRRRQVLRQQDGQWIVTEDLAALERAMPESVRSLVQRKIDALDDNDRRLLGAASVQGVDFDTAVLSAVLDRPEEEIEDRLERLEREHPEQKLSMVQALEGYTIGPAYAANMENRLGRLAPNYLADLIVLDASQDPFTCDADDLLTMQSSATMVGGDWVYTSIAEEGAEPK